jgi:outer membrane cobalamin receptor
MPSYTALDSSPTAGLFLGNPNLVRTTSRDTEVGASGSLGGWSLKGAVFYRRDDNLVDWTYLDGVFGRSANPVNLDTDGVELVARHSWTYVTTVFGYTALAKDAHYFGPPVTASFYALNYARQRLTAAFTIELTPNWILRLDNAARIQAADSLRTQGGNDALESSLGLSWHPAGERNLEITLQVDNLWNSAFQSVPSVPASRRQLSFGATYGW